MASLPTHTQVMALSFFLNSSTLNSLYRSSDKQHNTISSNRDLVPATVPISSQVSKINIDIDIYIYIYIYIYIINHSDKVVELVKGGSAIKGATPSRCIPANIEKV